MGYSFRDVDISKAEIIIKNWIINIGSCICFHYWVYWLVNPRYCVSMGELFWISYYSSYIFGNCIKCKAKNLTTASTWQRYVTILAKAVTIPRELLITWLQESRHYTRCRSSEC
jgi:hypothetical protein